MELLLLSTEVVYTDLKECSGQLYFFVRYAGVDSMRNASIDFLKLLDRKPSHIN